MECSYFIFNWQQQMVRIDEHIKREQNFASESLFFDISQKPFYVDSLNGTQKVK